MAGENLADDRQNLKSCHSSTSHEIRIASAVPPVMPFTLANPNL